MSPTAEQTQRARGSTLPRVAIQWQEEPVAGTVTVANGELAKPFTLRNAAFSQRHYSRDDIAHCGAARRRRS